MQTILQGRKLSLLEILPLIALTVCAFTLPLSVTATTVFYLLAALLCCLSPYLHQQLRLLFQNSVALSFLILFLLYVIGLTYSHSSTALAIKDLQKQHWLLLTPLLMLAIPTDVWRQRILNAFLFAMVITLFFSYLKFFNLQPLSLLFPSLKKLGPANVFFEQIVQNFFMSIAAFIVGYRLLFMRSRRWLNGSLFFLMGFNILFISLGRTGYIAFILLLIYLAWLRWRWKGIVCCTLAGVMLLGLAYVTSTAFHTRINQISSEYASHHQNGRYTSVGLRAQMWENSLLLIKQHPWLGYGTGGIRQPMQDNLTAAEINRTGLLDYVEFSLLNVWLQFGIFGLVIFLTMLTIQIHASFSLDTPYRHWLHGFFLAFFVCSLANSFFVSFCEAHLYSIFTALSFSAWQRFPLPSQHQVEATDYA